MLAPSSLVSDQLETLSPRVREILILRGDPGSSSNPSEDTARSSYREHANSLRAPRGVSLNITKESGKSVIHTAMYWVSSKRSSQVSESLVTFSSMILSKFPLNTKEGFRSWPRACFANQQAVLRAAVCSTTTRALTVRHARADESWNAKGKTKQVPQNAQGIFRPTAIAAAHEKRSKQVEIPVD